eukprot:CAMPEP_0182947334 /NCGR_PEP_ID=MMETSP0105_2-20130417/58417_1 /TAXON_ID=81532 ORGANISM="Acanthoeca-like sp., Strain 10tr" /NCGR_SAMPLE_ID=MMETSP0105_2 /ASSEMBLY_ACC=CAM_ASM_000205 /LENGTH=47 /DNA_ID= /DNA_START= /DNA_END= /DNA_ORIENTATION=
MTRAATTTTASRPAHTALPAESVAATSSCALALAPVGADDGGRDGAW